MARPVLSVEQHADAADIAFGLFIVEPLLRNAVLGRILLRDRAGWQALAHFERARSTLNDFLIDEDSDDDRSGPDDCF